jgi:hypothetical protein
MEQKDLFIDFTTLRWVKWTTRKPTWNGNVTIRWNSKWTSDGLVMNGELLKLGDDETKHKFTKKGKLIMQYTKNQKEQMEEMYWLEEIHDLEGYQKHLDEVSEDFLKNKK